MEGLQKHRLQAAQDLYGFGNGGFDHVDFWKRRQGIVFVENGAVFVVGGCADAAQRQLCQRRFEQVGRVHGAAAGAACADDGVDFVDKQNGVRDFFELFQTDLTRASKSPRYFVPANSEPISAARTFRHL